jgi:subtilisin family serine protease
MTNVMVSNRMKSGLRRLIGCALAVLLLAGIAGPLQAALKEPALHAALQTAGPEDEIRVIVEFTRRVDLPSLRNMPRTQRRELMATEMKAAAERDQQGVKSLLQSRGVLGVRHLWMLNSLAVKAPARVIRELAAHPEVQSVRIDRKIPASEILLQSVPPPETNISAVNANDLWLQGDLGQGAVVAVMDTGADARHPDLAGTWRGGTNSWFDPFGQYTQPHDSDGHGTSVLGIMVGGGTGGTTIGAAPGAKWIAARMFDDTGNTFDSVIHQVFQWLLDPDGNPATDDAPDVVNASWGFQNLAGLCENTFQPDIDALNVAGIAIVFAAGNTGPGAATSISPANNRGAIAVGSVDDVNVIDPTSARGPSACDARVYPDVVAPGDTIKTTDLSFGGFPFYVLGTGTSFSAPHASGVLALLRSAFPNATLAQLKSALIGSAADLGAFGPDNAYGNGLVDAAAAYALLGGACIRPQVDFTAVPFPAAANQLITFTSTVSGGTQPYSYAWDFNVDGVTDCVDAVCSHSYAIVYNGSVALTVTDANGCSSSIVIADGWAACAPIPVSFTFSPASPVIGQPVTFTGSVSGGTAPYAYEWDLNGDGLTDCTTDVCTTTYPAAFNGSVVLRVTDRYGCQANAYTAQISVAAAPPSSGGGGGGGGGGCFLSVAALDRPNWVSGEFLALALAGIALAAFRLRKR